MGADVTFKELVIDAIKSRWEGIYYGNKYDFCNGLRVNFLVDITERENWFEKGVEINIKTGVCGVSHQSSLEWGSNSDRVITLYTSYCDTESHKNQCGSVCSNYIESLRDITSFSGMCAHEIGHCCGLADMYASADKNHGYEPTQNEEIKYAKNSYGLFSGVGIMMNCGVATVNDIEMLMIAFVENASQYYVPYGANQKLSKAIKQDIEYWRPQDYRTIYLWDSLKLEMVVKDE